MKKIFLSLSLLLALTNAPLSAINSWEAYRNETIQQMSAIPGWCTDEKALFMMDIIKSNRFQNCIEIGVFSGKSLFPIAKALEYKGTGRVYGIDSWDPLFATDGFSSNDPNYIWWNQLDYDSLHKQTLNLIDQHKLFAQCIIIREPSESAVDIFSDESIDFIHFDGNHNEDYAYQDVVLYLPKIKDGGYIMLNDPNWYSMKKALVYLLERTDIISNFTPTATYLLIRKNKSREQLANTLLDD